MRLDLFFKVLFVASSVLTVASTAKAEQNSVRVGIVLPLTGADAEDATRIRNGLLLAIEQQNEKGGVSGYRIEPIIYDSGTATAGQYDPAQAVINFRKLIADPKVVAGLGPEMSGECKAVAPILSEADLATIAPTATNPDLTDPKFASQFRPKGKTVLFRTVTTDAFQGPGMANYLAQRLNVRSVYVLDDSGAYGVGIADAFEKRANEIGIKVAGRDRLNPRDADYSAVLTKIRAAKPDALYYGGVGQAGVKLAKQAYEIIPNVIKAGGDGVYASFLKGVGFPAIEGWYSTNAGPHLIDDPKLAAFVKEYNSRFRSQPSDFSLTAHSAALVVIDAIRRVAESGRDMSRSNVRDAIQSANVITLQGTVSFDEHGDIKDRTISVFQYKHNPKYPDDDIINQQQYLGTAPQQ
ncbi:branched-chain amino acid ABC transporter substrate-binding protein [Bradyrhizobium sp. HKCCYLS2038]|uniref:branched-chain amino acid ABC transporter substrate-binding protein n=1 Tax=unclassified Bradyrhizobium TaxID=2631580 RepID=UPI003EBBCB80